MIARLQSANDGSSKLEAEMRAWVAVTDREWYRFLLARPELDEVNFWQPSGGRRFSAIQTGEPFLFKLHYPDNAIVGGGTYLWSTTFPLSLTWEAFEQKNGAATIGEMRARVTRYRKPRPGPNEDPAVGCLIIEDSWFLPESDWIPAPLDWRPNIVQGKSYDLGSGIGQRMWEQVLLARQMAWAREHLTEPDAPMYGDPVLARQRLGQGAFRMLVTDAYSRRCAVTKEKALPVLQAAHIRPVSDGGRNLVSNGLLLRSDVHRLFDLGYVTITPAYEFRASRRLRDEFDNGEEYFAMEDSPLWLPPRPEDRPSPDLFEWHNDEVFLA
jgi:putative restriction endonuclease